MTILRILPFHDDSSVTAQQSGRGEEGEDEFLRPCSSDLWKEIWEVSVVG